MRIRHCLRSCRTSSLSWGCGPAQNPNRPVPTATLLATAHLESVADLPYYLRLYRARLPAAQ